MMCERAIEQAFYAALWSFIVSFILYFIIIIIIIIFYFENVAFFHAMLGSDFCPRVDNQNSGDTLQDLSK